METVALPIKARKHWMDVHTQKKENKEEKQRKKKEFFSNIVKGDWQLTLGIVLSFIRVCVLLLFCCFADTELTA